MSVEVKVREEEQIREELVKDAPWMGKPLWLVKNSRRVDSNSDILELCKYINAQK